MDDLLKIGLIVGPAGYLLLYAGIELTLFNDSAEIMSTIGVFGAFIGNAIFLYFGIDKLLPEAQSFSTLIQFFLLMVVLVGAFAPILCFLKLNQPTKLETE